MAKCNKQYIGETKRQLKERFNEHRRPVDKQVHPNNSKLTAVSEPVFVGMSILDISKTLMVDFHFNFVKRNGKIHSCVSQTQIHFFMNWKLMIFLQTSPLMLMLGLTLQTCLQITHLELQGKTKRFWE